MKLYTGPDDNHDVEPKRRFGTVVTLKGRTLVTRGDYGREHSHTMGADAQVTCRGKDAGIEDLVAGRRVLVTEHPDDEGRAMVVECLRARGGGR
jgi:hypothetical protein